MAIDIYGSYTNPISGETFRGISFSSEAYTMQWTLHPKGYVPFEHVHYHQDELFHIQQGELKVVIDGIEHIARAGEQIKVPKGARHIASNNKDVILDAIVTYTPALDHDRFMQCLCGLTDDGFIDNKGGVNIPMMGYCLKKMKCRAMARPTNIPAPAFSLALNVFYLLGTLKGWGKLYRKYTM
jgi:mannose-6-phosphate isomerase-like protein (cupin superfamily)